MKTLHRHPAIRKVGGKELIPELLLEQIQAEQRFLGIPYLTWWFEYDALEIFRSLNGLAPQALWTEWVEFIERAPNDLVELIQDHDQEIENLTTGCRALQGRLENSNELRDLYTLYTAPDILAELNVTIASLFGARSEEQHCSYLAQLIVNATPPDCSPLYTIRPLWLQYGQEFLDLRNASFCEAETHALLKVVERLSDLLKNLEERTQQLISDRSE